MSKNLWVGMVCAGLMGMPTVVLADAPQLQIQAQAVRSIVPDTAVATLVVERMGESAGKTQTGANAQLSKVQAHAKTAGVEVRTLGYHTYPHNNYKTGKVSEWRTRAEVELRSKDVAKLAKVLGELGEDTAIGQLRFVPSREQLASIEQDVTQEAIAQFQQRATRAAVAFGYKQAIPANVTVGAHQPVMDAMPRVMMARGGAEMAMAAPPVPMEAGQQQVVVDVSGTVTLSK